MLLLLPQSNQYSHVNLLLGDVAVENHSGAEIKVQRGGTLRLVHDRRHLPVVQRDLSDVVSTGEQQRRMSLGGLAPRMVPDVANVPVLALALESSVRVRAQLRTRVPQRALVHVLAALLVRRQLVALLALAVEALGRVHAQVLAAAVVHFALALVALVGRLVRKVGAVRLLVAHFRRWNTHAVAAVKLRAPVTCAGAGCHVSWINK